MRRQGEGVIPGEGAVLSYRLKRALYLNVTSRCTLRCRFCPKFHGLWSVAGAPLQLAHGDEPSAAALLAAARDHDGCEEIVFCGLGEPTRRLDTVLAVARELRACGLPLRLNTDGLASLIHGRDVTPDLEGLIDRVSISLNAHSEVVYDWYCRPQRAGSFAAVLAFARRARDFVPEVTLTAIAGLPGVDLAACQAHAQRLGVGFRIRPLESTDDDTFHVR